MSAPAIYALAQESEIWPGLYGDVDAAWRSAEWCTAHYAGAPFRVIDIRTGQQIERKVSAA